MLKFPALFVLIFYAGLPGLGSNNFRNSNYKEKTAGSIRVSRLSFCFLWLWIHLRVLGVNFPVCRRIVIKLEQTHSSPSRSSHLQMFLKKIIFKNSAVFTGKQKRLQHMCFPENNANFVRTPFFIEPLQWLLLSLLFHGSSEMNWQENWFLRSGRENN